jgi:dTDP-4-dehydrorhamnose reductase
MLTGGKYLVIGSDSLVGSALMQHFRQTNTPVIGTTRRPSNVCRDICLLDLSEDILSWQIPHDVTVAIICAGATSMNACSNNPTDTARINVDAVAALATKLADRDVFVIYLSTNQVFDGTIPFRCADDLLCPITEYGRQKAQAEHSITHLGDCSAIVRLTKILAPGSPRVLAQWADSLRSSRAVHPFSDMLFSPIPLSCVISVLPLIAEHRLSGIIQVSGNADVSYAQAALRAAEILDVDTSLVQPITAHQSDLHNEPLWNHTTLNIDRLRSTFGIEPPDPWWTLETVHRPRLAVAATATTNR